VTISSKTAISPIDERADYAQIERDEALFIQARMRDYSNIQRRFLDIGAGLPCWLSKTVLLHDEDAWEGVLVDPSPEALISLRKHYETSDRIVLVNSVITQEATGPVWFYDNQGQGLGSIVDEHVKSFRSIGHTFTKHIVHPMSLDLLLEFCPGPYSFVNIDAEGLSKSLWCRLPAKALGVVMACVECQEREHKEAISHAIDQGMTLVRSTALDLIFEKQ
jgi:hypothetical protein